MEVSSVLSIEKKSNIPVKMFTIENPGVKMSFVFASQIEFISYITRRFIVCFRVSHYNEEYRYLFKS